MHLRKSYIRICLLLLSVTGLHAQWAAQEVLQEIPAILVPTDIDSYHPVFHYAPVNQDTTLICWSFSTLSFIESEMHRLGLRPVRLAVIYPVYYTFIEKARAFVLSRGNLRFEPGDLFSTVFEIIEKYGIIPQSVYRGQTGIPGIYNQRSLYAELKSYMHTVSQNATWDEDETIANVIKILDKHLGKPPDTFEFEGKTYSPLTFLKSRVNIPWNDYMLVTSFTYAPYDTFCYLNVPDNWRQNNKYFNTTLALFYQSLRSALINGYSAAIDGDISESGRYGKRDLAFIPAYDISPNDISQAAREYRFEKGLTTDDHLMHIIGYTREHDTDWFLVKDSWRDAWEGEQKGYFFYREDYVKLKVLAYLIHKDAIPEITSRIPAGVSTAFIYPFDRDQTSP